MCFFFAVSDICSPENKQVVEMTSSEEGFRYLTVLGSGFSPVIDVLDLR